MYENSSSVFLVQRHFGGFCFFLFSRSCSGTIPLGSDGCSFYSSSADTSVSACVRHQNWPPPRTTSVWPLPEAVVPLGSLRGASGSDVQAASCFPFFQIRPSKILALNFLELFRGHVGLRDNSCYSFLCCSLFAGCSSPTSPWCAVRMRSLLKCAGRYAGGVLPDAPASSHLGGKQQAGNWELHQLCRSD